MSIAKLIPIATALAMAVAATGNFHPLFKRVGAPALSHLEEGHRDLEAEVVRLEAALNERRWGELYAEYTRFLGYYLVHLSEEEAAQRDILWTQYDDQKLLSVFNRFKSERPPQLAKEDLELMLPALNIAELARMFLGMKASAPPQIFQGACALAEKLLTPQRWRDLQSRVS